ncbi:MAG: hypothetical protein JO354_13495 [Verrucomicrobia bacterium]|nr:hypothetical protein [Verrucomicrobiota bacterium]
MFEPLNGADVNPDKLFNYLDGKLPEHERAAVEEELMSSAEARREFDVARHIHSASQGSAEKLEVVLPETSETQRGRRIARQIFLAALVLVALNVGFGLVYIARHEASNPNRALLEKQSRAQLQQALDKAAAAALTPPPLGIVELTVRAAPNTAATVQDEIAQMATRLGGNVTKGIPDNGRTEVLTELPAKRAAEFRDAVANLAGSTTSGTIPSTVKPEEKISIVVQIAEAK